MAEKLPIHAFIFLRRRPNFKMSLVMPGLFYICFFSLKNLLAYGISILSPKRAYYSLEMGVLASGLIKLVLTLHHGTVPALIHLKELPRIFL